MMLTYNVYGDILYELTHHVHFSSSSMRHFIHIAVSSQEISPYAGSVRHSQLVSEYMHKHKQCTCVRKNSLFQFMHL